MKRHARLPQFQQIQTRRDFCRDCAGGIGSMALADLLSRRPDGSAP